MNTIMHMSLSLEKPWSWLVEVGRGRAAACMLQGVEEGDLKSDGRWYQQVSPCELRLLQTLRRVCPRIFCVPVQLCSAGWSFLSSSSFSSMKLCISKWEICIVLESFPNVSIPLKQILTYKVGVWDHRTDYTRVVQIVTGRHEVASIICNKVLIGTYFLFFSSG